MAWTHLAPAPTSEAAFDESSTCTARRVATLVLFVAILLADILHRVEQPTPARRSQQGGGPFASAICFLRRNVFERLLAGRSGYKLLLSHSGVVNRCIRDQVPG